MEFPTSKHLATYRTTTNAPIIQKHSPMGFYYNADIHIGTADRARTVYVGQELDGELRTQKD